MKKSLMLLLMGLVLVFCQSCQKFLDNVPDSDYEYCADQNGQYTIGDIVVELESDQPILGTAYIVNSLDYPITISVKYKWGVNPLKETIAPKKCLSMNGAFFPPYNCYDIDSLVLDLSPFGVLRYEESGTKQEWFQYFLGTRKKENNYIIRSKFIRHYNKEYKLRIDVEDYYYSVDESLMQFIAITE